MPTETSPVKSGRPRVLLADDHPSVLVGFGRLLDPSCELVGTVSSGQDAVDTAIRLRPDILVVDLMMPDVDGLEVCRRVKRAVPETAVIIVTAFDDTHVESVALQAGAAAFVPKHSAAGTLDLTIQRIFAEGLRSL